MSSFLEKRKVNESRSWDPFVFVCGEDKSIAKVGEIHILT